MKFLRAVKRCTRRDKFRDATIREVLSVRAISERLLENKNKWKELILRMSKEII